MKTSRFKLITVVAALSFGIVAVIPTSCKKEKEKVKGCTDPTSLNYNAEAEEDDGSCTYATPGPGTSTTELLSKSVTTAPTMDGVIDASWANCQTLTGTAAVPSSVTDFAWYSGETYTFKLRSMRDATNIYFLAEWTDPKDSKERESWYFDATSNLWKQQNKMATSSTDKWYEDKIAFLWPTATTNLTDWNSSTCYSTCHGVNTTLGYTTTTKHYATTGEVVDMWHWKRVRTGSPLVNQVDDQKIISIVDLNAPTANEKKEGGRGSDASTSGGYVDNKQTLNNGTANVSVPLFIIPNASNYYWITTTDTLNGTAKRVTAVDATGKLTYAGGVIDPATGGYEMNTGAKRFPSIYTKGAFVGSRGDITANATHTGTGWVMEIKRALTTADVANDVQYDVTKEYMFGFAIFENAAIQHGIKTNLKLKF